MWKCQLAKQHILPLPEMQRDSSWDIKRVKIYSMEEQKSGEKKVFAALTENIY